MMEGSSSSYISSRQASAQHDQNRCAGLSSTEQQRFDLEDSNGLPNFDLAITDSNTWLEVNYTQLVANAQRLLPQVKPGAIPMAMVKVRCPESTAVKSGHASRLDSYRAILIVAGQPFVQ